LEVQGLGVMIQHLQDTTDQRYLIDRELSNVFDKRAVGISEPWAQNPIHNPGILDKQNR